MDLKDLATLVITVLLGLMIVFGIYGVSTHSHDRGDWLAVAQERY